MSKLTKEELIHRVQLFKEYKEDPIKFIEECLYIPTPGGDKLINLYEPQKRVLKSFYNDKYIVLLKSRQIGMSTLTQMLAVHLVLFYDNVKIGIISRSSNEASDFLKLIKDFIKKAPSWLLPGDGKFKKDTARQFELKNGSAIYTGCVAMSNPSNVFRGKSLTVLVLDECGFICKVDEAWCGLAPTLSVAQADARDAGIPYGTIILSTPNKINGLGKFYYQYWTMAFSGDTIWKAHKIHWKEIPRFANDPTWYKQQCEILGNNQQKIAQELNLEFIGSEDTIFDVNIQRKLNQIEQPITTTIIKYPNFNGTLWIFEPIVRNNFYLIGVDSASSSGTDYSTIEVIEYKTCKQIMEFKGKLEPKQFASVVKNISDMMPKNLIIVERTGGYGLTVLNELESDENKTYNIYSEVRGEGDNKKIINGLNTDRLSRPLIIEAMYNYVIDKPECLKSERLAMELLSLTNKTGNKVMAESGFNDDLVMAFAFTCYVREYGINKYSGFLEAEVDDNIEEYHSDYDEARDLPELYNKVKIIDIEKIREKQLPEPNFVESFITDLNLDIKTNDDRTQYEIEKAFKNKDKYKNDKENTVNGIYVSTDEILEDEMFNSDIFL